MNPMNDFGRKRVWPVAARLVLASAIAGTTPVAAFAAGRLSPLEAAGKEIYLAGKSPSGGEISAHIGALGTKLPGTALPCATCHGRDGTGRPEGGVVPPNITWRYLTKSYGHRHPNGRQHPAFDEDSLARAIAGRTDPAGNRLEAAMPMFRMSDRNLAALIAYMKRLGSDLDPGLTDKTIRIGSILPSKGPLGALGRAAKAMMAAYFTDVNMRGGIFGRKIEFRVLDYSEDPASTVANARRLVDDEQVFAVVGAFTFGIERKLSGIFESRGVPHVGPFSLFTTQDEMNGGEMNGGEMKGGGSPGGRTFHLLAGLADQARALVDYAALHRGLAAPRVAVVLPADGSRDHVARAISRRARKHGWPAPTVVRFAAGHGAASRHVDALRTAASEAVFYFGPTREFSAFVTRAAQEDWLPDLFLSGLTADAGIIDTPAAFDDRLFLAYPTAPSDLTRDGYAVVDGLQADYKIGTKHRAAQIVAFAAARVLVEGLRRSGRTLSRTRLTAALEGLNRFDTGLLPPISFGPNRRVGSLGAHILAIDLGKKVFRPDRTWISLE